MKLLAVPTRRELNPVRKVLDLVEDKSSPIPLFRAVNHPNLKIVLCGMGATHTAISLSHCLSIERFQKVILIGVAGIHPRSQCSPGDLVGCLSETYLRLGSVVNDQYEDLTKRYCLDPDQRIKSSFQTLVPKTLRSTIPWRHFGTSDWITSTAQDLEFLDHFHPYIEVENMEGASAAHVCQVYDCPLVEIRAVVNYLGNRDPRTWSWKAADMELQRVSHWILKDSL